MPAGRIAWILGVFLLLVAGAVVWTAKHANDPGAASGDAPERPAPAEPAPTACTLTVHVVMRGEPVAGARVRATWRGTASATGTLRLELDPDGAPDAEATTGTNGEATVTVPEGDACALLVDAPECAAERLLARWRKGAHRAAVRIDLAAGARCTILKSI
jgi:hypothetical protein